MLQLDFLLNFKICSPYRFDFITHPGNKTGNCPKSLFYRKSVLHISFHQEIFHKIS